MFPTREAISQIHRNAHRDDKTSETHQGCCTTPAQGHLFANSASDDNVLIVDWDGPDDPENPRKYASTTASLRSFRSFYVFIVGASDESGEQLLSRLCSRSSAQSHRQ